MKLAVLVIGLVATGVMFAPVASAETCEAHLAKWREPTPQADVATHARKPWLGESPCKGGDSDSKQVDKTDNGDYNSRYHDDFGINFGCGLFRGCGWG